MKVIIYFLVLSIIFTGVYASDIKMLTYRNSYSPLETLQVEIIFNKEPLNELNNLNIGFYKDNQIGILPSIEKINNKSYFIYFNIPKIEPGQYKFKIRNVDFIEGNILRRVSKEIPININDTNTGFKYLIDNQNRDGSFFDITATSLAALALKNINNEKSDIATFYLLNNADPTGCYPKWDCNVKDTSFALIALSKFNKNYVKTKNWLKDAGNNFNIGLWNLMIEGNSICNNIQINGAYNLNLNNNIINVSCSDQVNFELIHNNLGNIYILNKSRGNIFEYVIDNSGCYGEKYRSKCDYINTLYASWALKEINENFPEAYLINNKMDNRTIDHALGYIIYNNNLDKEWLLNNYLNGYWSYHSAYLSQQPDLFTSAFATYSLKNEFIFEEAKEYLRNKTRSSVLSSALILYLLFDDERNIPSISINPGISNKKNNFNLKIKNNRHPINLKIESPEGANIPSEVLLEKEVTYSIDVNDSFNIIINYEGYSYTIPVIGPYEEANHNLPLLPPPKNAIKFLNKNVELRINREDSLTDEISFTNEWEFRLNNIKLNITGRLKDIVEFEDDYFESLGGNQTLSTLMHLNKDKSPKYSKYEGYLTITSSSNTIDSIKFSVIFERSSEDGEKEANDEIEENDLVEENQEEEQSEKDTQKKDKKSLWWLWIIILLILGIIIFFFFRRKKEVTQSFEEYAKKIKT